MSWGTQFMVTEYINRLHFDSKQHVKDTLQTVEEDIVNAERKLYQLAACTPKDICVRPEDYDTALDCVNDECRNYLELYRDNILLKRQLELLLENWKTKMDY